ncbi:MAG: flavodoxin-dependent (E)-4-hydroxy-3-methylbut-2-enyl-diphosphate synthase [Candidatus Omnitrophica bacterium]|nr:flavodoxin-dependent (E)-4-hydroxy-3-methylbut-2-enyl-diphosphate synthase [Candidatus Omnitrophota bacterium]MBU4590266.1 flavodoxin-dependent (E)-4-hydroxy-3-methylbut-2-enyl-diphosphate synthase [Candidatus Omnitrophota bacterium]
MTKQIKIGKIRIGGRSPVVIQSMTKTDTRDVAATVRQIKELEKCGCELVRVAVKDFQAASALKKIKKKIKIPLAADIHFDHRLAIAAIENGADKIRLNPGNIRREEHIIEVAKLAKKRRVPIRVGVNSGSIPSPFPLPKGERVRVRGSDLVKAALDYIKVLEKARFYDIIVSLKASDVLTTIEACRIFSKRSRYPLHLGITAAGPVSTGLIKSSIGIGALLLEGIGDTIRVSLTGDPCEEVAAAKNILQALGLRRFGPDIISCPTCGRCQVDLRRIVADLAISLQLSAISQKPIKIAVMGCEVNGPGEAKDADIGIAFGKGAGVLFKKGKIIKRVKAKDAVKELTQ